jgi:hypothetical protein
LEYKNRTASDFASVFTGGGGSGSALADKWKWYPALYQLAGEDFLRMEEVTQKPINVTLQHLAFLKDLAHELKQRR